MLTGAELEGGAAATVSLILYSGGKSTARGVCTIICARMRSFSPYQEILVICTIISVSRCICSFSHSSAQRSTYEARDEDARVAGPCGLLREFTVL